MLPFLPTLPPKASVLLLGAHCDDIEIGAGATISALAAARPQARFHWVTLASEDMRAVETEAAAARFLAGARDVAIVVERFRGSYFPTQHAQLKDYFETLKPLRPDLILTHHRADLHQDHRTVNELTWNTFRDHLILEYEIPKFDGDLGQPNLFVPLDRSAIDAKIDILMSCFPSQRERSWFTPETFLGLARLRGVESASPGGYAEAFHLRKARMEFELPIHPSP
jgi:LmbE family N-acetylglucosaminyl deacetylase